MLDGRAPGNEQLPKRFCWLLTNRLGRMIAKTGSSPCFREHVTLNSSRYPLTCQLVYLSLDFFYFSVVGKIWSGQHPLPLQHVFFVVFAELDDANYGHPEELHAPNMKFLDESVGKVLRRFRLKRRQIEQRNSGRDGLLTYHLVLWKTQKVKNILHRAVINTCLQKFDHWKMQRMGRGCGPGGSGGTTTGRHVNDMMFSDRGRF